jgi:hypothetical protein
MYMFNQPYSNYSFPNGYAPQNYMQRTYPPQPQVQPQMQQPQAPMPMEIPIQDIKFVNKAQADAYIVFPNTKVMLIDKESGMVYVKTADNMGQSQTQYFRFEPTNPDGTPIVAQEPTPPINLDNFVTIDKFNELSAQFAELKKMLIPKTAPKIAETK